MSDSVARSPPGSLHPGRRPGRFTPVAGRGASPGSLHLGASSGLLSAEDAAAAAEALEPDTVGLFIVYENLWSKPFAVATRKAGGQLVAQGHIPTQAIVAALDELES